MENTDSQGTLPNLETIFNAIIGLRQEVNDSINGLRQEMNERFDKVEARLTVVEGDVGQIKEMVFVFENEFDRLLALNYKSLELSPKTVPMSELCEKKSRLGQTAYRFWKEKLFKDFSIKKRTPLW